jgi:FkbM family methyltransferase
MFLRDSRRNDARKVLLMWLRSVLVLLLVVLPAFCDPKLIREDKPAGLELWDSALSPLWIPKSGASFVIKHLEWEQTVQKVYEHPSARVQKGDIVIDCGAHIGGFTRMALQAGAQKVIAVEPESLNIQAFRRNFGEELKSGRVMLVEKGVWNKDGSLSLHLSQTGDMHSVAIPQNAGKDQKIEVVTIDSLIRELKLPRIDFIKMDIEGAEQDALKGASLALTKWRPRLAISSYHQKGDPAAICSIVWGFQPSYRIVARDLEKIGAAPATPKVLFFY